MPRVIPLLVIAGPTATGKTDAAIRVARSVGGEIISADSMQIYRHLDVGTAKPTPQERSLARFHLVDFVDPEIPYTVADFQGDAARAIQECHGRGNLPILCGGTGLYIRALLDHFDFPPWPPAEGARVRAELEAELARVGPERMHRRLAEVDPDSATQIGLADAKRIVRALEVYRLTGAPMSAQRRVDASPTVKYNPLTCVLSRPRAALYAGIDARVDSMMAAGWLDEVRWIRAQGYDPALQCIQAIGYRHLYHWLTGGEADLAGVIETIKRDTRRFAKRQLTWFRRERDAVWYEWDGTEKHKRITRDLCRRAESLASA